MTPSKLLRCQTRLGWISSYFDVALPVTLCCCFNGSKLFVQYAKQLADDLREKIKALGYDRHKLVVQVRCSCQNLQLQLLDSCDA